MWKALATASFQYEGRFGSIKLVYPRDVLLAFMYQARTVCGHVFKLGVPILLLSTFFLLHFGNVLTVWYFPPILLS